MTDRPSPESRGAQKSRANKRDRGPDDERSSADGRLPATDHAVERDRETIRIESLLNGSDELYRRDPRMALGSAEQAYDLAHALPPYRTNRLLAARALLAMAAPLHVLSDFDRARERAHSALEIFESLHDEVGIGDAVHKLSALELEVGQLQSAATLATRALKMRKRLSDDLRLADTLMVLAHIHMSAGDHAKALRHGLQSFEHATAAHAKGDRATGHAAAIGREAVALQVLGAIYSETGMYVEALDHYAQSLERYHHVNDKAGEAGCLYRMGRLEFLKGDAQLAIERTTAARDGYEALGERLGLLRALNQLSAIHLQLGDFDHARHVCNEALHRAAEFGNAHPAIESVANIGELEFRSRDYDGALDHLNLAIERARVADHLVIQVRAANMLQDIHETLGNFADALKFARLHAALRVELTRRESAQEIKTYQTRAELAQARAEADRLKHESEKLRLDARHQSRELSSLALHLVERKSFLEELRRSLSAAIGPTDGHPRHVEQPRSVDRPHRASELQRSVRQAIKKIGEKIDADTEFRAFEEQLNIVQDDFLKLLAQRFPELTSTERKICVLLRLDLSTKDIAGILHISPLTVNTHRRRIRQKLGLRRTNLISFLLALEPDK